MMFKNKWWKRGLVVALVMALSAGVVGVVSAHGGGDWFGRGGIDREALLAEELGITVEDLQSAQEAAHARALDQALDQGLITQEQYDQLRLRMLVAPYLDRQTLLAEALGIELAELNEKTLAEWLEELDLDRDALQERLQVAVEAALEQAVADGVVTQEQVDTLKDKAFYMQLFPRSRASGRPMRGAPGRFGGLAPELDSDTDDDTLQNNSYNMRGMLGSNRF
ncbi:MAG: hypothetical protein JW892_01340 [Anaerolineae bacterium]|nr:hypothetical protein [Anaerolineae bacterium]